MIPRLHIIYFAIMNSAFYALRIKIESIKHALTLLGTDEVRKWASLMLMLRLSDQKPKRINAHGDDAGKDG